MTTANAIYGTILYKDECFGHQTLSKIGNHDFPESLKYDPVTKVLLWESIRPILFTTKHGSNEIKDIYVPNGLGLITNENKVFIGATASTFASTYCSSNKLWADEVKELLKNFLMPVDLWMPERLALYAVLKNEETQPSDSKTDYIL